jgi:hypothetical protein
MLTSPTPSVPLGHRRPFATGDPGDLTPDPQLQRPNARPPTQATQRAGHQPPMKNLVEEEDSRKKVIFKSVFR